MTRIKPRIFSVLPGLLLAAACGGQLEDTVEVTADVSIGGETVRFARNFTCRVEAGGNDLAYSLRRESFQIPGRVMAMRLPDNSAIILPLHVHSGVCATTWGNYHGKPTPDRWAVDPPPVLWLDDAERPTRVEIYQQPPHGPPLAARMHVLNMHARSLPQMAPPSDPAAEVPWLGQATDRMIFFKAHGAGKPCWLRHLYLREVLQKLTRSQVIPDRKRGTFNDFPSLKSICRMAETTPIGVRADPDKKELHLSIGREDSALPLVPQRDLPEYRFLRGYSVWINGRPALKRYAPTFYDAESEMVIQVNSFVFDQSDLWAGRPLPRPHQPLPP